MFAFGSFLKYMLIGVGYNCIDIVRCKIVFPDVYEHSIERFNNSNFFAKIIAVSITSLIWPLCVLCDSVMLVKTLIDKFGKEKKQP